MKRTEIVLMFVACLMAIAGDACAGEQDFTIDGGLRLYTAGLGFQSYDVATNGNAMIKFMWLKKDGTVNAGDVLRADPEVAGIGNRDYLLRSEYPPRHFGGIWSSAPDSVYIDLQGATEVILTW